MLNYNFFYDCDCQALGTRHERGYQDLGHGDLWRERTKFQRERVEFEAGFINGFLTLRSRVPAKVETPRLHIPRAYRLHVDPIVQAARCSVLNVCHMEKYGGRRRIISSSSSSRGGKEVEPSDSGKGFGRPTERRASSKSQRQERSLAEVAPAEALIETLGGLSTSEGRVAKGTSMILGTDTSLAKWREMDEKVNSYPDERTFKAIGSGNDFADKIVQAVASVTGSQGQERVVCRPSAGGKYLSVTIGPVLVQTPEQVIAIYAAMREDPRLKWYL